jgi:predicted nucleotide-binding protein
MKERFEGPQGLRRQDIVQHDLALATALAEFGSVKEFEPGAKIVVQGAADNSVFFLLAGDASLLVNERFFGIRSAGTCIGEMSAIDSAAPRSATIQAKTTVVALEVPEHAFRSALDSNPIAYKPLAQLLAQRLRQRSIFVQPPNPQPVLFIGSSAEAIPIANELQMGFKHDPFTAVVWPNGVFGPGGIAFDSLAQIAASADFAAFVISPDDTVLGRESEKLAPRDNVVFELGLFMGQLARERVFLVQEHGVDLKIPSDLLGITPVTYLRKTPSTLEAAIAPACHAIRKAIIERGVR